MKHKKVCKMCKNAPKPIEIYPGCTIYPSCVLCGRKAVNIYDLSPEEFGAMLAREAGNAYRKLFQEFFK